MVIILTRKYNPIDYPFYDSPYDDIINVDRIKDIPAGYYGKIGVPITIVDWYGLECGFKLLDCIRPSIKGRILYKRIVIEFDK